MRDLCYLHGFVERWGGNNNTEKYVAFNDFSIKTLAKYLGFNWRDAHPSGTASIQWFDEWVKTGSPETKQRILDYNEDDCVATRVLLEGIR